VTTKRREHRDRLDAPKNISPNALSASSIPPNGSRENSVHAFATPEVGDAPITGDKRMLTVEEFCRRYSIGNTMTYAEMKAGHLRFCKVGRRRLIRVDDAEAWSISKRQPPPCAPDSGPAANRRAE